MRTVSHLVALTLMLALPGQAAPSGQPPAPESAVAFVTAANATLVWTYPVASVDERHSFNVYGIEGGVHVKLEAGVGGNQRSAVVQGGFEDYSVTAVVDGTESAHVRAVVVCYHLLLHPPFIAECD